MDKLSKDTDILDANCVVISSAFCFSALEVISSVATKVSYLFTIISPMWKIKSLLYNYYLEIKIIC